MPLDQLMKKLEAGKMITGITSVDRHFFKLEMETDIDTIKKLVEFVHELGKAGQPKG